MIFETVASLLSLLRTGARDAYRLLFIDAMLAIEGKIINVEITPPTASVITF